MTGFETVLISALTSAAVALAIEWAAKPNLEVRKERILGLSKTRHEIIRQLRTAIFLGQFLGSYVSDMPSFSPEKVKAMHQSMTPYYNNFTKAIDSAVILYPEVASTINPRIQIPAASVFGNLQGLADSKGVSADVFNEIVALSELLIALLELPRWNYMKRRKLLTSAKERKPLNSTLIQPDKTGTTGDRRKAPSNLQVPMDLPGKITAQGSAVRSTDAPEARP